MKWLVLYRYTGTDGSKLKTARRIARKIQGAQRSGQCIVVDCSDVTLVPDFLRIMAEGTNPEKVKFAGLPIRDQLPNHPKRSMDSEPPPASETKKQP